MDSALSREFLSHRRLRQSGSANLLPWPLTQYQFYRDYKRILKRAGLPHGRKDKCHKIRRSVASHLQAMGIDACTALGHSTQDVTRKSYLDPRIVLKSKPSDLLPNPLAMHTVKTELIEGETPDRRRELPRLSYRGQN